MGPISRCASLRRRILPRVGLVLGLLVLAACQSAEQSAQSHYERGVELQAQGDLVKASLEFRQALQGKPDLVPAMYALGTVLEQQKQLDAAVASFQNAAEHDPKRVDARVRLGRLLLISNQLDGALKYADQAFSLAEGDSSVLALKAAVALRLGNRFDTIKFGEAALAVDGKNLDALMVLAAERLTATDPAGALTLLDRGVAAGNGKNVELQLFRIASLQARGDDAGIEATFKQLLIDYPSEAGLRDSFASWYAVKGRTDQAEGVLRTFATANPTNAEAALTLVEFLRRTKGADAARTELTTRIAQGGNTVAFRQALAQLAFADGKYPDAVAQLTKLIDDTSGTDRAAARIALAKMMAQQKDWAAAGKQVDAILAGDAKNTDALSIRAALRVQDGKVAEAIEDLRAALNLAPQSPILLLQLADAFERTSRAELADEQYAKALRADPANPAVVLTYVDFLLRYGRDQQAERVLTDLRAAVPGNVQVLTRLAQLRLNRQDWVGAQEVADALGRINNPASQSTATQFVAAALAGQQKYDDSLKLLQSASAQSDVQSSPMAALVRTYVLAGKQDVAQRFLESVLTANPGNQTALVLRGSIDLLNGNQAAAEAFFRAAISADPTVAAGHTALVQFFASSGRWKEAEEAARAGLQQQPADNTLRLLLATVLEQAGDFEGAIKEYETMYAADPRSTIAANNLASLLSDVRKDTASLDRAFDIASRFRTADVPQFQDTLGWIYYLRGDYSQALTLLKSAADRLPTLAAVQFHLGMAYKALGQKALAVASLTKAQEAAKRQPFAQQDQLKVALDQLGASDGPAPRPN